ncbi:MAG TPA: hypothetical protein VN048_13040 [Verrucomicrobiae bacterium]|jgi:hypothetical protein|nr:hypothetical protein [Verrucomicrobiae bacterium]
MPDNETSLDIVIRTRAELEGAQSVETQLEHDIEKARELGREYAAQEEAGLQSSRAPQSESSTPDVAESELQTTDPGDGVSTPSNAVVPASIPQTSEFPAFDSRGIELQAQAIQEAGEKMRAALEQNGQVTLMLLNGTLALIEEQTRKMEDMDRQLGQLAGRIKGLKNP